MLYNTLIDYRYVTGGTTLSVYFIHGILNI